MADRTAIHWTATYHADGTFTPGATWNPIRGTKGAWACEKVSPACAYCYAEKLNLSPRFGGHLGGELLPYLPGRDTPRLDEEILTQPLRWQRPRKIFVCSMTDIAWEAVPFDVIRRIWVTMTLARRHMFLVLTKRSARLREFLTQPDLEDDLHASFDDAPWPGPRPEWQWPLPNVWIGATVENQFWANRRVPELLRTPAAVRLLSMEPLLGPVNLRRIPYGEYMLDPLEGRYGVGDPTTPFAFGVSSLGKISWVIVGGESGGPENRRLVRKCLHNPIRIRLNGTCEACEGTGWRPKSRALAWVTAIRDHCAKAGVAFFHKQWGGPRPTSAGRLLEGREWNEFPKTVEVVRHA